MFFELLRRVVVAVIVHVILDLSPISKAKPESPSAYFCNALTSKS